MTRPAAMLEEARDMADTDDREAFRQPGPGERECGCDEGLHHWMQDVREGVEVCVDCNGSGVLPMEKAA